MEKGREQQHSGQKEVTPEEVAALRERLREAEEALRSIRRDEVDALIIPGDAGDQVLTLPNAERPYRLLIEQMQDGALTLSDEDVVLYSNQGFARLMKLPLESIVGEPFASFAPPEEADALGVILGAGRAGSGKGEIRLCSAHETFVPVYLSATALHEDNAHTLGVIVTDLTTQKRNEQVIVDEKLARAILEYASIAIVVCDPDGIIVRDSQMCRELAGGSVLQKPFTEAFALQADFSSQLRQTLQGATFGGLETRFQRPDGRWFDLMVSAGPLRGPQNVIQGCIIALTDITERKRSETDLRGKQRDIEALNHRLQRAMSETHHRVKNNLQVIIALVNMQLMDHPETVPSGELRRLTHHIKALATIHDLMTFQAKTDAEMTDVSVKEMVERFIPIVRDMMTEERELTLHVEELRLPVRYVTAVAVVLNELISNAAKHGEGVIGVRITNGDGIAHLEVTDEGPGFPPDFNPLTAANTGLDLLTSLVEWDLRGTMRYANNPNGGACVEVAFPIHEA